MVMIVKDHEKKAWGFISVTWITARAHVSALPGPYAGVAGGPLRGRAAPRMPLCAFGLPPWTRTPAAVTAGPMTHNDWLLAPGANAQAAALAAGWPGLTCYPPGDGPRAVVMGDLPMEGSRPDPLLRRVISRR